MKMETNFDFSLLEESSEKTEVDESILESDVFVDKKEIDKQIILLNFIDNVNI